MVTVLTLCIDGSTAHRWLLDDPTGGIIGAVCMRCGSTRTFNSTAGEVSGDTYGRAYNHDRVPVVLGTTMAEGSLE